MEATQQFTQPDLFPDVPVEVPANVVRIWRAVLQHYERHLEPPSMTQLKGILFNDGDGPYSEKTIERVRKRYPEYFPCWPIPRGMRPPWEPPGTPRPVDMMAYQEAVAEAGMELVVYRKSTGEVVEVGVDQHGRLCLPQYLSRGVTVLAASLGTLAMLDSMDGRVDGIVHWCVAIARMMHQML